MLTSGFFNSTENDPRAYNAEQMSSIFDGIINDGVFQSIGDTFRVSPVSGNTISIGTGRGWFNHTWVYNNNPVSLALEDSNNILDRYDAIVIEIDHSVSVRASKFSIVKGSQATNPAYPTITNTASVVKIPIAYIIRRAGSTSITVSDITGTVGTKVCPFVTGPLEVRDISYWTNQWEAQFSEINQNFQTQSSELLQKYISDLEKAIDEGYISVDDAIKNVNDMLKEYDKQYQETLKSALAEGKVTLNGSLDDYESRFSKWFETLKVSLEDDVAANLASKIVTIELLAVPITNEKIDSIINK